MESVTTPTPLIVDLHGISLSLPNNLEESGYEYNNKTILMYREMC